MSLGGVIALSIILPLLLLAFCALAVSCRNPTYVGNYALPYTTYDPLRFGQYANYRANYQVSPIVAVPVQSPVVPVAAVDPAVPVVPVDPVVPAPAI